MGRVRTAALAGAGFLTSTAAFAADMPQMLPPVLPPPPIEEVSSGWYLRGDIGISNQELGSLRNALYDDAESVTAVGHGFDSAGFAGLGVGVNYNSWLRFDVTGEYRGKANFKGGDRAIIVPGWVQYNDYRASKSEWLFMANAYVDLGTWWCLTPFVGVGVGMSRNTISSFRDMGINSMDWEPAPFPSGPGLAPEATSTWNFAWAVHAGLAYKASQNVTFEIAYRYLSLGDATSAETVNIHGRSTVVNPFEFKDVTSHDIKFGVRFSLDPTPAPVMPKLNFPPPLMRRG